MADTPPTIDPNSITKFNEEGLTAPTLLACIQQAISNYLQIDPNVSTDSNSPIGQQAGIIAKQVYDNGQILSQVANSFNVQTGVGTQLDDIVAITGLTRSPATFTYQDITVVITAPCNLPGLDANVNDPNAVGFTVADNLGNEYILANTQNGLVSGTYTFLFRAKDIGHIVSTTNTITNIITTVQGVQSVNNPSSPTAIGTIGESDSQLRARQQLSPANASNGNLNGMYGLIASLPGINYTPGSNNGSVPSIPILDINNNTDKETNQYGNPGNNVWVIVSGGSDTDIATTMNNCVSAGCGMKKGAVAIAVPIDPPGNYVMVHFDRPIQQIINLRLTLGTIDNATVGPSIIPNLINYLVLHCIFGLGLVYGFASEGNITPFVNEAIAIYAPNQLTVLNCELSKDGTNWFGRVFPDNLNFQLTLDTNSIQITIV